jgi:probable rRNA maturation factor
MPIQVSLVVRRRVDGFGAPEARAFVRKVLAEAGNPGGAPPTVVFTDDEEIRRLNREFRGKDRPTDVLSFPEEGPFPEGEESLGDVVVSVETAARQAKSRRRPVDHEVRILLIHGLLHLLGHDHETDDGEMAAIERRIRRKLLGAGGDAAPGSAEAGRKS